MTRTKPTAKLAPKYEPTPVEREAVERYLSVRKSHPPTTKVRAWFEEEVMHISNAHPEPAIGAALLAAAIGADRPEISNGLVAQLMDATRHAKEPDVDAINFAVSVIASVKPQDALESLIAAQMAAVHVAAMKHVRMMNHSETIPQLEVQERTVNKLMRTFAAQMTALKKYRSSGEQKVTVEHVTVNEGGQAIVGSVRAGGRGGAES